MFATVPVPQKGDRISAAWGTAVADGINALTPFAAAHGLVRQGVGNGTEPLPENRRERKTAADHGCYFIDSKEVTASGSTSTLSLTFGNPYYRCGGKTYEGEDEIEGVTLPAIVALKVTITGNTPSAELESYATLGELQDEEEDEDCYILPLYKFKSSGEVECDFRNAPNAAMWEFANPS